MTLLQAAALTVFPALVIVAALTDVASFTIPNRLTLLLAACYLPVAIMLGRPLGEIGLCLAIGAAALVVAVGMFAAGWIGGGDAKLFAGAALWLGWPACAGLPDGHRPGRRRSGAPAAQRTRDLAQTLSGRCAAPGSPG